MIKKGLWPPNSSTNVSSSATTSDLNRINLNQQISDPLNNDLQQNNTDLLNSYTNNNSNLAQMPSSKSENVLNKFKKPSLLSSSSTNNKSNGTPSKKNSNSNNNNQELQMSMSMQQQQQQPQQLTPKGRLRCQVVYLDESVKTFDIDVISLGNFLFFIFLLY